MRRVIRGWERGKFVVAQNAHDLKAVGEILQDSPQMFWITRGQVYWGRDAALKRFGEYYQGTWALEPKTNEIKVVELSPDVAQLFAPTVFRIASPGGPNGPSEVTIRIRGLQMRVAPSKDDNISSSTAV